MEPKIGIVLVNYNGENFQNDCIRTIKNMDYNNYKIIVVDNDSKDNSVKILKEEFDDVIIIETGENCGVAKGNNIGIKKSLELECDYVLLLNNDTEVDKHMLKEMVKTASENTMVTCKMYYYKPDNTIWCAGGKINWDKATTTHFGENDKDNGEYNISKYIEYTPTCCLLIHRNVFDKIGFMDEKYFMYYDDTDFIARANAEGFRIWYEANAKLWHKVSSSSGGMESNTSIYYGNRNRMYFIDKFYNSKIKVKLYFYFTRVIKIIKYAFKDRNKSKIIYKAIIDYKKDNMYRQNLQ